MDAVFQDPVPANIAWDKIEALMVALGAEVIEGKGSRVAFLFKGRKADFHRPHPGKEAKRYQIRLVREFLEKLGVKP